MLKKYYGRLFLKRGGGGVCRSLTRKCPPQHFSAQLQPVRLVGSRHGRPGLNEIRSNSTGPRNSQTGITSPIRRTAVREAVDLRIPRHHGSPVVISPENPRTSGQYGTDGFKEALNWAPHDVEKRSRCLSDSYTSELFLQTDVTQIATRHDIHLFIYTRHDIYLFIYRAGNVVMAIE